MSEKKESQMKLSKGKEKEDDCNSGGKEDDDDAPLSPFRGERQNDLMKILDEIFQHHNDGKDEESGVVADFPKD